MPSILITSHAYKLGLTDRNPIIRSMVHPGSCVVVQIIRR